MTRDRYLLLVAPALVSLFMGGVLVMADKGSLSTTVGVIVILLNMATVGLATARFLRG